LVFGCLIFACAMASAETMPEHSDADAHPVPTAADVISQLYQFDQFQQNAVERADPAPSSDVLTTAAARAEAAAKRDKALAELQRQTGTDVPVQHKAAAMRAHSVEAVDRTDGPAYVRQFYAVQLAEYELTVPLIEEYLQSPDNENIRSFAAAQLPVLLSELADTRHALANK
jgi:erythromycin esterase-like protein